MAEALGNPEKAVLIALLLAGEGEVPTPDLKKNHGVSLAKKTREQLNDAGLIVSNTAKSPHLHKLTEKGKVECEEVLASGERPAGATAIAGALFEIVGPIVGYLRERGIRLFDVIHSTAVVDPPLALEDRIRVEYQELSEKPQDWVRLALLRPRLDGAEKKEVDQELLKMIRTGLVHLAPDSDRKALTAADHDAALRIGKEDKHLLLIEES
jgi:hypothetical protein